MEIMIRKCMPTTSLRIITIVVTTIALLACIGMLTLAYCLLTGKTPDQNLLLAFVGLTTANAGALTGLLVNTRSSSAGEPPPAPMPTTVVNSPENPVQVEQALPHAPEP